MSGLHVLRISPRTHSQSLRQEFCKALRRDHSLRRSLTMNFGHRGPKWHHANTPSGCSKRALHQPAGEWHLLYSTLCSCFVCAMVYMRRQRQAYVPQLNLEYVLVSVSTVRVDYPCLTATLHAIDFQTIILHHDRTFSGS